MKLTKQLTSLIGFSVAGFMFLSCSDSEKANYQIIPIPQEIKLAEQGEFLLNEGTKVLYPEGNAEARFPIRGMKKILFYCNRDGLFFINTIKGIDDKECSYDNTEERRELEQAAKILFG